MSFCSVLPESSCTTRDKMSMSKKKKDVQPPSQTSSSKKSFLTTRSESLPSNISSTSSKQQTQSSSKPSTSAISPNEYNIFSIDAKIREKLTQSISTLPALQKDLTTLLWIMENSPNPMDKVQAQQRRTILRNRIKDIESTFELGYYLMQSQPLLQEYKSLMEKNTSRSFVSLNESRAFDPLTTRKNEIIMSFLRIASTYIQLKNFNIKTQKLQCADQECKSVDFLFTNEGDYVCKKCGTTVEMLEDAPSFKDTDRVNLAPRFSYTEKGHMNDAFLQHQGLQNANIDPYVYEALEEERIADGIPLEKYTKKHMYLHLQNRELSDYYEHGNLIHSVYTKTPAPNILQYKRGVFDMFPFLEEAYEKVKDENRINSMNVNFKLFKSLQLLGCPVHMDDFYFLKTDKKLREHMDKWKEMMELLAKDPRPQVKRFKWRFIP